ncbi:hypothetical protein BKD09_02505 [Bradyrhizobium japonicum]|uniref:Uncharacterized protein n=1 Tax=Bradyrhizobium japonicum TaxID=375 RepID=A0A1L3F1N9_BRAJP|nr:hypothetical protein BKD09_02505 [Bradyrhizobium japonicum]
MRPPSPGLCSAQRHRRAPRAAAGGRRPEAAQPEFRLRARPREAFHPVDQGSASPPGLCRGRASVQRRDGRAGASERHRGPVWPLERARHRGPVSVILQPEACRDVRRSAVHRGDRQAVRQACCPVPALPSAQVSPSEQAWRSVQPRQGGPQARPVKATA